MSKFKVGDRVRIASGPNNGGFGQIGDTGVIEIVGKTDCLVRYGDGSRSGEAWYVGFGYLEPVAVAQQPQLTIEAGKFYITRDGRKVGPMCRWSDEAKHRWEADDDDLPYIWPDDGTEIDSDIDDSADIVAEADEPPAEPQSTKEILDELEAWIAEQDAIKAAGKGSTAGFTVPLFDDDDETAGSKAPVASIADIVRRLERLESAASIDESAAFRIGDKVTLRATVTGRQKKTRMNITLDDVSGAAHSIVVPAAALTAA